MAGEALALERFCAQPPAVSAVVLAAGGGEPLLDAAALIRLRGAHPDGAGPLLIDFGVPPNVDPAAAQRAGLPRVGMSELVEAGAGTAPGTAACVSRRCAPPSMRSSRACAASWRRAHSGRASRSCATASSRSRPRKSARALAHELRTLDEPQRAQLERLARTVALRLAHLPLAGLRSAAVLLSPEAADAFFAAAQTHRDERARSEAEAHEGGQT